MDRNMIVVIILVLLILLSIFQTFQLTNIRAKVIGSASSTGKVATGEVVTKTTTGQAIQLPRQVGGC